MITIDDPTEQPKYELVHTGVVLDQVRRDLRNLSRDPAHQFSVDPMVWAGPFGEKVYRPPGVWMRFRGDRSAVGSRLLFWFPEPYHPLEALAAYRGLCGTKTVEGVLAPEDWALIERVQKIRYQGWAMYTAELGRSLLLYPSQVRVLYHLLTPLKTNGCEPETERLLHSMRSDLFDACGVMAPALEWAERAIRKPDGAPTRMQFWGSECAGRIEL